MRSRLIRGVMRRLPYRGTTCETGLHQFGALSPEAVKGRFFLRFFRLVGIFLEVKVIFEAKSGCVQGREGL